MPDSQDFNPNKDINRYLAQQGRAPQSHFDWETWRKIGQPGAYQAPPGYGTEFRGVTSGAGGPNYNSGQNHYNMFSGLGDVLGKTVDGVGSVFDKMKERSKSKKDSGSGSMASGNATSSSAGGNTGRSQGASITAPATSRGMRRSRGGDFNSTLAQHNITMVQGNDNYGTIHGNMGGANVGGGYYDNSFQSKNTGGIQTAFSGNNNAGPVNINSGNNPLNTPPGTPTTEGPPPPPPPGGPEDPEVGKRALGQGPEGPTELPYINKTPYMRDAVIDNGQRPALPTGQGPSQYGNTGGLVGTQETTQGPVNPSQKTLDKGGKVYGLATDQGTTPGERQAAQDKWHGMGFSGPFPSEGPQAPAPGMLPAAPVEGPTNPASKTRQRLNPGDPGYKPAMGRNPINEINDNPSNNGRLENLIPTQGPKNPAAKKAAGTKASAKSKGKK